MRLILVTTLLLSISVLSVSLRATEQLALQRSETESCEQDTECSLSPQYQLMEVESCEGNECSLDASEKVETTVLLENKEKDCMRSQEGCTEVDY